MAVEIGIPYAFISEDGARVVLGGGTEARADPDWVGYLAVDDGISGLIDGGDQRGGGANRPGQPGGYDTPSLEAPRVGSVSGTVGAYDQAQIVAFCSKLSRSTRANSGDGILTWTPTGATGARMIRFRRRTAPTYKGRRPKTFAFSLSTRDPYALSVAESVLTISPAAAPGELGVPDPVTDPMTSPVTSLVAGTVVSAGDAPTWPRFRITGPVMNPEIVNFTTGARIKLNCDLADGQALDVLPEFGIILLDGVSPRYQFLDVAASSWWRLQPGSSIIRLVAASYAGTPILTVRWRDAYE